jgi:threonine 3-dehydrogenase
MKAIVKKEAREGLWMIDIPEPKIGPCDLLIKIIKTSICGTDVHLYKWDDWAKKTLPVPSIIGHEFVGMVVDVGQNVKGFKVGDRVSGEGHITCGQCYHCQIGQRVLCSKTVGIGINRDGCFAQYLSIPEENAFLLPADIPDEVASIFDPLGNAVHTALSFDLVGQDVLITGAGPIGIMAIPLVKKAGARRIVITDVNDYRLNLAQSFQPNAAVNVKSQDLTQIMEQLDIQDGFSVCLEMSGSPAAFQSLPQLASNGGKLVLLGILPSQVSLDWHAVIFKMLTIKGIYGREIFRTWHQMTRLLQSGLDVKSVITHRFAAEEFQKGFDAMISGQSGKIILDWSYLS